MTQGVEQGFQGKVLDVQRHHALTYLHPMTQHIVVVIDFVDEFTQILEAFADTLRCGILVCLQLMAFVQGAVKERRDAIHNRHRRQFLDIQTLVLLQTLLKHESLTLQTLLLFRELDILQALLLHPVVEHQKHVEQFLVQALHRLVIHFRPVLPLHLREEAFHIGISNLMQCPVQVLLIFNLLR